MSYQIQRGDQTYGPYTRDDLVRYVGTGHVLATDLVKSDDMPAWVPVAQFLGAPAPPPPPGAAAGFEDTSRFRDASYGSPVEPREHEFPWFPVSPLKFALMSVCTLGLYHVYWAYKQWNRVAGRTGEGMMVWARAIFLGIWNFPLFGQIRDQAKLEDIPASWNHVALGVFVLLFALSSRLPAPFGIISLFSFLPYLPVVITVQRIHQKRAGGTAETLNSRFSGWNIAALVFGGAFALLAVVGFLVGARASGPH